MKDLRNYKDENKMKYSIDPILGNSIDKDKSDNVTDTNTVSLKSETFIVKPEPMDAGDEKNYIPEIEWQLDSKIEFKNEIKQERLESLADIKILTYLEFQQTFCERMKQKSNNKFDLMQDFTNAFQLDLISREEAMKPVTNECIECGEKCKNVECPIHGELQILQNKKRPEKELETQCSNVALFTTPGMLKIGPSKIKEAGVGVFTVKPLKKGEVFGPYKGDIIYSEKEAQKSGYSWEIFLDGCLHHYIDGKRLNTSNWMRFVNCANTREQQSLEAIQIDENIFYRAVVDVDANIELLVFYGAEYLQKVKPVKRSKFFQFFFPVKKINPRPDEPPECNMPNNKCTEPRSLVNNTMTRFENKQSLDNVLDNQYTESNSLGHLTRVDIEEIQFVCNVGNYKCKTNNRLSRHIKLHTKEKKFECKECNYKSSYSCNMKKHIRTHTGENLFCKLCNYRCTNSYKLTKHMRTHTGEKPFVCKFCNLKFALSCSLTKHIRTHTGEKPFLCKFCDYRCTQSIKLTYHMRTHTGEKPFQCKLCEYKSAQYGNLTRHMMKHTEEKPFLCKLCDYKCRASDDLTVHMRTHTGEKPYQCKLCNYRCKKSSSLIKHTRTHTGEKPFKCNLCEYKCNASYSLTSHMRTHTGEKPFHCNLCNYRCKLSNHLTIHMRTHTGEKPYKCNLCEYKCKASNTLTSHMRTHTGEEPYRCELCKYSSNSSSNLTRHMRTHS